jgi:hypothetical protein
VVNHSHSHRGPGSRSGGRGEAGGAADEAVLVAVGALAEPPANAADLQGELLVAPATSAAEHEITAKGPRFLN